MAIAPDIDALKALYGPHPQYSPGVAYAEQARRPPDRLVKTHCCFCGQQCGIQLKVIDNQVVGFEPWEEFPFNRGMLCPKGVRRYLQNAHPDRPRPLMRSERRLPRGAPGTRRSTSPPAAARDRKKTRARRHRALRRRVAHHREGVPARQVRPPRDRHAGTSTTTGGSAWSRPASAYKLALGIDRSPNPWADIPKAQVRAGRRRQHRRVRADYDRLRLAGPRQRRAPHRDRSAHDADHAQRRPVPARASGDRSRAPPRHAARRPARRAGEPRVHRRAHDRLRRRSPRRCAAGTPPRPRTSRACRRSDRDGRALVRRRPTAPWRCTRAASSTSRRASRTAWRC